MQALDRHCVGISHTRSQIAELALAQYLGIDPEEYTNASELPERFDFDWIRVRELPDRQHIIYKGKRAIAHAPIDGKRMWFIQYVEGGWVHVRGN